MASAPRSGSRHRSRHRAQDRHRCQARTVRRQIAQQYARGDLTANDRRRFGELCDEWGRVVLPTINKPATQRTYSLVDLITGSYPQVCLEEMQLKRIISQHIVLWLSALNGYGWNTKQNALTLCRRIFDAGIEWGRIVRNPHSWLGYLSPENYIKHQKVSP